MRPQCLTAAAALFRIGEADIIDWDAVCDIAFMTFDSEAPDAIELLLKAGKTDVAMSATFHLLATNWKSWFQHGSLLSIVKALLAKGRREVAISIARWLALWPGNERLEACETLLEAGEIEEASTLLRFVACECHDITSVAASRRLLMLNESDVALPVLVQVAETASPHLQYEASLTLSLRNRTTPLDIKPSRIELKSMVLDERQDVHRAALDKLYENGLPLLGEPSSADQDLIRPTAVLGHLSLSWLCGRSSLREQTSSLPDEIDDISLVVGANLALFEWRGGHLKRAMTRMRKLAARHDFDTNLRHRLRLLRVLARVHGHEMTSLLEGPLHNPDPEIRVIAIESLGEFLPENCANSLVEAAGDPDERVRSAAASMLGKIRYPGAVEILIKALDDESAWVRKSAAEALGRIGHPSGAAAPSRSRPSQQAVSRSAESSSYRVESPLKAKGLGSELTPQTGTPASLIALLGAESDLTRIRAGRALGPSPDSTAVDSALKALLNDSEGKVRAMAVSVLGRRKGTSAYRQLLGSLRDQQREVRKAAAEALGRYGCPDAIEPLLATAVHELLRPVQESFLDEILQGDYKKAFASIAQALARLNAVETLQFLVTYAISDRDYMKSLIPLDANSALRVLDRFANPLRDEIWPHWLRGHALWRLGRLSKARTCFREAVAGSDVDSHLSLALFDLERDNLRGAIHHVDQALEKSQRPIDLLTQAVVQCRRGEIGKAQDNLEQARRQDPYVTDAQDLEFDHLWRAEALSALSELLGYVGEYESAVSYSEVAEPPVQYDPKRPG